MTGARKGFVEYDSQEHCIRAWWVLMRTYRRRYGCTTVRQIVTRYASPSENDTVRYVGFCCRQTGLGPDCELKALGDYDRLGVAMARMETGTQVSVRDMASVRSEYHINL